MGDEEQQELVALEASGDWSEAELDRLYYLRMRKAGVCTWGEVIAAINATFPVTDLMESVAWVERMHAQRLEDQAILDGTWTGGVDYVIVPYPGSDG